jgi:RNA polymerase subunit RPABC4/transcription elongation factor Spt4
MWAKKSNNLDGKIFICTNCKAKVSENDMICPKCGANLEEIVE